MPVLRSPKLIRGGGGEVRTHDGGDDGSGGERRVGVIQKERL